MAIESDVTHSSLDRFGIYAVLRVPEIWRLTGGDALTFHVLGADGQYEAAENSLAMPLLTPAKVMGFLQLAREAKDQNTVSKQVIDWVRQSKGS